MARGLANIRKLELQFAEKLANVDDAALGEVCAGIIDIPDSYRAIFEERLSKFNHLDPEDVSALLEELTEMRSHFEHIRWHSAAATAGLDRLIELLGRRESALTGG